jgi:flagellar biosynthesis/type III secretory pathway protein FliH
MIAIEWNITTALEVEREEGYEKGLEKGLEKGHEEVLELLSRGYTLEAIKEELARPVIFS